MVNIFFVIKFNYNYFIFKNFKHKFKIGGWGLDGSTSAHMQLVGKDENIGNHGYIDTSILRIYRRYISGYFGKKYQ